jgi:hypothetical protein
MGYGDGDGDGGGLDRGARKSCGVMEQRMAARGQSGRGEGEGERERG